jgi:hypothetical protein
VYGSRILCTLPLPVRSPSLTPVTSVTSKSTSSGIRSHPPPSWVIERPISFLPTMLPSSLHHHSQQQFFAPTTTPNSSNIDSFYYNSNPIFYPSSDITFPPSKRAKNSSSFDFTVPSTFDCPPLSFPTAMPQALHRARPIAPHINLQRASEPASPVTIASTLSTHSTPSPSPQRVTIVSDNTPDFSLYEDFPPNVQEHQLKPQRFSFNTPNPSSSPFNGVSWPHSMEFKQPQYFQPPTFNGGFSHRANQEDLPALSPSHGQTSRPSISEIDMPVTPIHSPLHGNASHCAQTPANSEKTYIDNRMDGCLQLQLDNHNGPKLARTVSDAVQDELFNPGIAPGTARSQPEYPAESNSQLPTLFQHAQNQHAMARGSPAPKPVSTMRDRSPFRANSPFHPARSHQEIVTPPPRATAFLNPGAYTSARVRREKDALRDAELLKEQMKKEYEELQQTPKTISPKDAFLEYHEPEANGIQGSLFGSSNDDALIAAEIKSESDSSSYGSIHGEDEGSETEHSYASNSRRASDVNMDFSLPTYNGNAMQFGEHLNVPDYGWGEETSSRDHSDVSRQSDSNYELASSSPRRPEDTMANDGAYSCTVHGCTQRFPTASKMSKHRREAHRNTPMGRDAPTKSLLQGPSRCQRINPTTGKPCNTVFSRPYDLTRHEDTIHNTARQKVRCELCNDDKTFSRYDALTRHKKVKFSEFQR